MQLSPDGKLAAVLHEGVVSLVDVDSATLVHSSATGGSQTGAFVTNAALVYLVGQTGGQWTDQTVGVINGNTGVDLTATLGRPQGWSFYGTMRGVYSGLKRRAFVLSDGLSPADIDYFSLDASGAVTGIGTGALLLPDTAIGLPIIGGSQSYGKAVFHSANDNHVALVQTGSATSDAVGLKYFVVTR
jgi:hypothetical protein